MGLFDAFVNDNSNLWPGHTLETMDEFETILKASFSIPQLIFKHSTRCNISHIVKNDFISNYGFSSDDFGLWHLDLLAHRNCFQYHRPALGSSTSISSTYCYKKRKGTKECLSRKYKGCIVK